MDGRTLQYADIMLEPVELSEVIGLDTGDTGIQYDYFDSIISRKPEVNPLADLLPYISPAPSLL